MKISLDEFKEFLAVKEKDIIKPIIDEIIANFKDDINQFKASDDKWRKLKVYLEELDFNYTAIKSLINNLIITGKSPNEPCVQQLIEDKMLLNKTKIRIKNLLDFEENENNELNASHFLSAFIADLEQYQAFCRTYHIDIDNEVQLNSTNLSYAARLNTIEHVDFIIKDCVMTNTIFKIVATQAVFDNNIDLVKHIILKYKIAADELIDDEGTPYIHVAAMHGFVGLLKFLNEECSVDLSVKDSQNLTVLDIAIYGQHLEIYHYLIQNYNTDAFFTDENRLFPTTALHIAANLGSQEVVRYEIETLKTNPKLKDSQHNSVALLHAAVNNHSNVIKYLLAIDKTNINICIENQPALSFAVKNKNAEIVDLLVNDKRIKINNKLASILMQSAYDNHDLYSIKILLEHSCTYKTLKKICSRSPEKNYFINKTSFELLFYSLKIFLREVQFANEENNAQLASYKTPYLFYLFNNWDKLDYKLKNKRVQEDSIKANLIIVEKIADSMINSIEKLCLTHQVKTHVISDVKWLNVKEKLVDKIILAKIVQGNIIISDSKIDNLDDQYIHKWLYSEQYNQSSDVHKIAISDLDIKNKLFNIATGGKLLKNIRSPLEEYNQLINKAYNSFSQNSYNIEQKNHYKNLHLFELKRVSKTMSIEYDDETQCKELPFEVWVEIASYLELNDIKMDIIGQT